ncbi:hypothetical protein ScPMuIL_009660 [Solemya velum]
MYRRNYPGDPGMHNMGDHNTRVDYRSNPGFLTRVGNSLVGIVVGVGLLVVASGLLFWNEGRSVQTARSLEEGLSSVVSLENIDVSFVENNGRLVHLSGPLKTERVLRDPMYNVAVQCTKLKRQVEMYQWVEHESKREFDEGGETRVETSYSYSLEWKSTVERSSSFYNSVGHNNPSTMIVESIEYKAEAVHVGTFLLSEVLVDKIADFQTLPPQYVSPLEDTKIKLVDGVFYHSDDPYNPKVGDYKVTFAYAGLAGDSKLGPAKTVSVIARQDKDRLVKYTTMAGDDLELLYQGQMSPKEIFLKEEATNAFITWGIRFGGWLLMFVGFGCLTSIITTLVDWIPLVRNLVAAGVMMMNAVFAISLSLTVIALGWIRYRPWLGISILVLAVTPFIISKFKKPRPSNREPYNYNDSYSRDRFYD